jgi:hypothetical protein
VAAKARKGQANRRQKPGLVWKLERKSIEISMTIFAYSSLSYLFYAMVEYSIQQQILTKNWKICTGCV